jgi:hypothetical protein
MLCSVKHCHSRFLPATRHGSGSSDVPMQFSVPQLLHAPGVHARYENARTGRSKKAATLEGSTTLPDAAGYRAEEEGYTAAGVREALPTTQSRVNFANTIVNGPIQAWVDPSHVAIREVILPSLQYRVDAGTELLPRSHLVRMQRLLTLIPFLKNKRITAPPRDEDSPRILTRLFHHAGIRNSTVRQPRCTKR